MKKTDARINLKNSQPIPFSSNQIKNLKVSATDKFININNNI